MRMPSPQVLSIEKNIALAHRSLCWARDTASQLSDLGLYDDLQLHLLELERLQVDLLRSTSSGKVKRRRSYVSQSQERP